MKHIFFTLLGSLFLMQHAFAQDAGVFQGSGVTASDLRTGEIHTKDIPNMIISIINFGIYIAGSIAIIFIIVGAYKILFGSIQQDKTKGKDTIIMAIGGFIIATLAWFIINFIMTNI